jgi:non-ribosomal peptide synthetase component E (peptide arylation enzyme)
MYWAEKHIGNASSILHFNVMSARSSERAALKKIKLLQACGGLLEFASAKQRLTEFAVQLHSVSGAIAFNGIETEYVSAVVSGKYV